MGRGRAKAKQTKVARDLKYSSPQTDFQRLQKELGGPGSAEPEIITSDVAPDDRWPDDDDWRR